jgi:RNA polymerase primary sigma factor
MAAVQMTYLPFGALEQYLREVNAVPQLSDEEERQLLLHIEAGKAEQAKSCPDDGMLALARSARARLVEGYQALVIGLAKRYLRLCKELELLDLVQEGNLGLLQALDTYHPHLERASFRTWAFAWVRGKVFLAIWRFEGAIRLPLETVRMMRRMEKVSERLLSMLHREPTIEEIAKTMGIAERDVRELIVLREQKVVSLYTLPVEDGANTLEETFPDVSGLASSAGDAMVTLEEAMALLPERERVVVKLRYGFEDGQARSHREVAALLDVPFSTVAALDRRAQARLRKVLASA